MIKKVEKFGEISNDNVAVIAFSYEVNDFLNMSRRPNQRNAVGPPDCADAVETV
jgi:hypothetical protein